MIGPGTGVRVYLACGVTDIARKRPELNRGKTNQRAAKLRELRQIEAVMAGLGMIAS